MYCIRSYHVTSQGRDDGGYDDTFQPHYELLRHTNPMWPNVRTSPIFEPNGHAQAQHRHHGRMRDFNSASQVEDDRLQVEREREWELARKLELERKMAKQREEEEEKRSRERERLIAMEKEREEFRMKQIEKQRQMERIVAQQEEERMMKIELERERLKKVAQERERFEAEQERKRVELEQRENLRKLEQERRGQISDLALDNERGLNKNDDIHENVPGQYLPSNNRYYPSISSNSSHLSNHSTHTHDSEARNDFQLPTSPAPPPYKADNEHAQFKSEHSPKPPPPVQFAFHSSVLGVMPDFGTTDFSGPKPQELGASHLGMRMNLRSARHSRSPRLRSPQPRSDSMSGMGLRDSASPVSDEKPSNPNQQRSSREPGVVDNSKTQTPPDQPDGRDTKLDSDSINKREEEKIVQPPRRSESPDLFQELDELLGGMNAMVSEAEFLRTERLNEATDEEVFEAEDDTVIQPPPAFNGRVSVSSKDSSAQQSAEGSLPKTQQAGDSHPKADVLLQKVLHTKGGKEESNSQTTTSSGSEQWLEGSPVIEERRVPMEGSLKRASQTSFNGIAGVETALPPRQPNTLENAQPLRECRGTEEVESRQETVVLIQPPSPYKSDVSREWAGSGSSSSVPPPIPPLPDPQLLREVNGGFEDSTDQGHVSEVMAHYIIYIYIYIYIYYNNLFNIYTCIIYYNRYWKM